MQSQPYHRQPQWTILRLLKWATDYFKSYTIDSPRAAAEILLADVLGLKRIDLYVQYEKPLSSAELSRFKTYVQRRVRREPVAYITGRKEFWSLDLRVTKDVLIPRPETECLVEASLELIPDHSPMRIFEIGTGSGAISIALISERPELRCAASDRSIKAVEVAKANACRLGMEGTICFFSGDGCFPLRERMYPFDMIVSNPPYIKAADIGRLQPEIFMHEPRMALDGGADGLQCIRHIVGTAHSYLKPGGILLLEVGHDQRAGIRKIIEAAGVYGEIIFRKDYSGYDRVVRMRKI
jgi:release factor glutamine methyltransferase